VGGQSVMDIIFREIREFGVSLILLDQHPSKISLYAMGNTYATICMNLKHKTDINAMAQCLLMDKDKDILGSLEVGQAVVKLQGRIAKPFQIKIPLFKIQKGSVGDDDVKKHMQDIAPPRIEEDFRLPVQVSESIVMVETNPTDKLKIAFLKDIDGYPDSGIASRYKRLGISVRQGQKIKERTLKENLILENMEISNLGRVKAIQLTCEGKKIIERE